MFREFFDAGAAVATPLLPQFKTQELANLLWSFANQTMYHEAKLLIGFGKESEPRNRPHLH